MIWTEEAYRLANRFRDETLRLAVDLPGELRPEDLEHGADLLEQMAAEDDQAETWAEGVREELSGRIAALERQIDDLERENSGLERDLDIAGRNAARWQDRAEEAESKLKDICARIAKMTEAIS